MRMRTRSIALLSLAAASTAAAQTQVYFSRSEWEAALGGASVAREDFNAVAPQSLIAETPTTLGQITVTLHNTTNGTGEIRPGSDFGDIDGTPWFRGFTGSLPPASWTFTLPEEATAYGADYDSPASGSGIVLIVNGESLALSPIGTDTGFFGFITQTPFTSFRYERDPVGTILAEIWSLDNLAWANTGSACLADFNGVGGVTVQDIFDFLTAYFGGEARADINGVGGVTVQDIFDFLTAYFAGC